MAEREWSIEEIIEALRQWDSAFYSESETKWLMSKAADALTAQSEWIPCSRELPKEDGQYLITVKYKHVDGYEDVYSEHGEWVDGRWDMFCSAHCGEVEDIIAWCPLPEPYRTLQFL